MENTVKVEFVKDEQLSKINTDKKTHKLTQEQKDYIVDCYINKRQGGTTIGRALGIAESTVKQVVLAAGHKMRNLSNNTYRKYTLNENYFDKIDTADKAYWLGFLYADGYNHQGRAEVKMALNKQDTCQIEAFKLAIGANQPLKENACNKRTDTVQIVVNNRNFSRALAKHGCTQNKSFTIRMPELEEQYLIPFMLGYFDGDGSIYMCKNGKPGFNITSNFVFCTQFQDILIKYCGVGRTKLGTKKITAGKPVMEKAWAMVYTSKKDIESIYNFLYSIPVTYCLKRKKDKFEAILDGSAKIEALGLSEIEEILDTVEDTDITEVQETTIAESTPCTTQA